MTISFKDRVAIVTGAGGGLGRAYALELAKRGAKVVPSSSWSCVTVVGSVRVMLMVRDINRTMRF